MIFIGPLVMPGQNRKWSASVKTILMAFCLCLMYHAMIVYDCVMYLTDLFGYWMIKREKNILFSRAYMLHSSCWSLHTIVNLVWLGWCDLQQQFGRVILWGKQYFRYGWCFWGGGLHPIQGSHSFTDNAVTSSLN